MNSGKGIQGHLSEIYRESIKFLAHSPWKTCGYVSMHILNAHSMHLSPIDQAPEELVCTDPLPVPTHQLHTVRVSTV